MFIVESIVTCDGKHVVSHITLSQVEFVLTLGHVTRERLGILEAGLQTEAVAVSIDVVLIVLVLARQTAGIDGHRC